ncbi:hypothetical protein MMC19_004140 [Ptychographa xylographoides]|nr:hypothetical protein [Ptychographa xylographoides]
MKLFSTLPLLLPTFLLALPTTAYNAGTAQFFYDDHCVYLAGQVSIAADPYNIGRPTGGPYGSRSAMWLRTGDLHEWTIREGTEIPAKRATKNPPMRRCVAYRGGIYVTGDFSYVSGQ